MNKILKALLVGATALLVSGCGSSGGDTSVDPMTERQLIVIAYHTPAGTCETAEFQDYMLDYLANDGFIVTYMITRDEALDVSCATYGKANDITEDGGCLTIDLALFDPSYVEYKNSCVVGVDVDPNSPALGTKGQDISLDMGTAITNW